MVAGRLGFSYGTCQQILMEDLSMQQIFVKFVPQKLTDEQKQQHASVCQELLDDVRNNKNFLSRVITPGEAWFYCYDPETKQ
jgi:hypothetical protein